MGISLAAAHLSTSHAVAGINVFCHGAAVHRFCKTGPAAAGIKFVGRNKERFTGNNINIKAGFMVIIIFPGKRLYYIVPQSMYFSILHRQAEGLLSRPAVLLNHEVC